MNRLPCLCVCGLVALLLLESGRGPSAVMDAGLTGSGATRSAPVAEPVQLEREAPMPSLAPATLSYELAGEREGRLRVTRTDATVRYEHAFGLAFEHRVGGERPCRAPELELWWSAELGAPLRVERRGLSCTRSMQLVALDDAPPGSLLRAWSTVDGDAVAGL